MAVGTNLCKSLDHLKDSLVELKFYSDSKIKNHIPNFIETIVVYFLGGEDEYISNVPLNIKKIKIKICNGKNTEEVIKYLKVPFGCIVTDIDDNIIG